MLPPNLYARVHLLLCATAHETAGAARTRSSLRPLIGEEGKRDANLGQVMPRDREPVFHRPGSNVTVTLARVPSANPHPEEPAERASRRMQATDGPSWLETRFALLTMRGWALR
jgi:hypothetical protein